MVSNWKTLATLVVFIVTATAGAIWHFAPMDLALANQEKIAMMDQKGQLEVWEDRRYEMEERCVDPRTDEWLCTLAARGKYDHILREIKLLEKQLGLEKNPDEP